jgi:hypothetical protein
MWFAVTDVVSGKVPDYIKGVVVYPDEPTAKL